ncbi:dead/deah box helicase [Lucifera butyrica]|uniref:ATP-dependent DNA helicase RecG n=1 Tax=Lucifera butyrica TaxID=1351585 RepID=A0A498R5C8_9FIRM|nr:ATP-dependent DNA helicase RecG [Lucifera butyrica]VBB07926.1 dead/deah box helicase [Lucifera butyrica]
MLQWLQPIKEIKGIGPARAALLAKLNIFSAGDLLEHFPRRYEDRRQLKPIQLLADDTWETFTATVTGIEESKPRRGLTITKVLVRDATGAAQLVWFNQSYRKKWFKIGMKLIIAGKVKRRFQTEIHNPEIELADGNDRVNAGCIVPVYPASEKIQQRFLRSLIRQVLDGTTAVSEPLPADIITRFHLLSRKEALENIHFPANMDLLEQARYRLVFEELYLLQCGLAFIKRYKKSGYTGIKHLPDGRLVSRLERQLPFTLTEDQKKVWQEIKLDMEDTVPMQRLIQGDVGSGKTVLAALALAKTIENGYQGAMMVPTEILAEQHYHTLAQFLAPLGVKLTLLTGKLTRRAREETLEQIRDGLVDVVVGTHALIQDDVSFHCLGLVITDEQHRFGVRQRSLLQSKGGMPDVLVMTATPIPRTMALTVYGDLDVSVIRQLPPGRKEIKTYAESNQMRERVYRNLVVRQVESGRQAYVVCPLVEESENIDAQSAVQVYEQLTRTYLRNIPCCLLHGKLKATEKEAVMEAFCRGECKVLVATTVIEVGVNVPNATVMVIEGAERFGLAQLHQLRGRIGRGQHQSYCVLLSDSRNAETKERLKILAQTSDGFLLAEKDLLLRGPGQFFGSRQHGLPDLKIADIVKDTQVLIEARRAALTTANDPQAIFSMQAVLQERFGDYFSFIFRN